MPSGCQTRQGVACQCTESGGEAALLVRFEGESIRQQWPLNKPVMRIGRWPDNDIVVEDRWVSRYHAEVRREGQTYTVHDLGSKNGTYVNGRADRCPAPAGGR